MVLIFTFCFLFDSSAWINEVGIDKDEDMAIKYPRVLAPLRDKKVCSIALGGLHNAVVTETGQVYTWGCNDDGSLGREGNEGFPALVESIKGL